MIHEVFRVQSYIIQVETSRNKYYDHYIFVPGSLVDESWSKTEIIIYIHHSSWSNFFLHHWACFHNVFINCLLGTLNKIPNECIIDVINRFDFVCFFVWTLSSHLIALNCFHVYQHVNTLCNMPVICSLSIIRTECV